MLQPILSGQKALFAHGAITISAGMAVCGVGSMMAKPSYQPFGYLVASTFIAGCLLIVGLRPGLRKVSVFTRPIVVPYVALGFALMCYAAFSSFESGSSNLPIMELLTGLLGLFWAAWYLMLACRLHQRTLLAVGLTALAAVNTLAGATLALQSEPSRFSGLSLCGVVMIILGVEIYLTAIVLYREVICDAEPGIS